MSRAFVIWSTSTKRPAVQPTGSLVAAPAALAPALLAGGMPALPAALVPAAALPVAPAAPSPVALPARANGGTHGSCSCAALPWLSW
jgi:hypothetical protein